MLEMEFKALLDKIQQRQCEEQTIEVKSATQGCPERLYDAFSSFSNQDDGGVIVFGLNEKENFVKVGVYDAQDLQRKLMEVGKDMNPIVRPVLSVYEENGLVFVAAEIPPMDLSERPCFKAAKGRLKGSYVRVGDADQPMTEYEVYSYEAFRKRYRDDIRPIGLVSMKILDQTKLEEYLVKRQKNRANLAAVSQDELYNLTGIMQDGQLTLMAMLLFGLYPQAYFPQLSIIATRVPGTEIGLLDSEGQRFLDSERIEGSIPEMLETAMNFLSRNMRKAIRIDQETGKRTDTLEYPVDALRETILNALVHRDYSVHTESMPIQITMFSDRIEIRNPGGLYGRLTVDQLGKVQPDTRNPFLATAMETIGQTENRYSGIPSIRHAMQEANLTQPVFLDNRREFSVCLYNNNVKNVSSEKPTSSILYLPVELKDKDDNGLLTFCLTPRTRAEITEFLGLSTAQYAMKRYLTPLIDAGFILLSNPDRPKSRKQTYRTNPYLGGLGKE